MFALLLWQSFIQNFFGGGGKNDVRRSMPPRGCGVCFPRKFLKFTFTKVASGAPKKLEMSYE